MTTLEKLQWLVDDSGNSVLIRQNFSQFVVTISSKHSFDSVTATAYALSDAIDQAHDKWISR